MTSTPHHRTETLGLPQYGFGAEVNFGTLLNANHFLFRVYTPVPRVNDPYFIAPKFEAKYNSPLEDSLWQKSFDIGPPEIPIGTYEDVVKHMDWTTRLSSPFISTSFSFIWSIWEALRRYHFGVKKDVEIAVIDARRVSHKAVTAVQLLRESLPSQRRREHWKWYRFSQESQSVLVHGYIAADAVLASIPLLQLLDKLPSYFLRSPVAEIIRPNPLLKIGWDYTEKKPSYRNFCLDMSNQFLQLSPEIRLQDTTTGSVRLAISFLRPWFHRTVVKDSDHAIVALCSLSYSIAQWPGQWWTQEHTEIQDLIRAVVFSIAEEIQESQCGHKSVDAALTRTILKNEVLSENSHSIDVLLDDQIRVEQPPVPLHPSSPAIPFTIQPIVIKSPPSPLVLAPPSVISRTCSQGTCTPITPPASPTRPSSNVSQRKRPPPSLSPSLTPVISPPSPVVPDGDISPHSAPIDKLPCPSPVTAASPPMYEESLISSFPSTLELPSPPTDLLHSASSPGFCLEDSVQPQADAPLLARKEFLPAEAMQTKRKPSRRPPSMTEKASCIATGFVLGACITLYILAPQRRTLLSLT